MDYGSYYCKRAGCAEAPTEAVSSCIDLFNRLKETGAFANLVNTGKKRVTWLRKRDLK